MSKLLFLVFVLLTSCASLSNFQEQPVVQFRDAKTFKTTCNGIAEDWGSCYRKAKRTCANGYEVSDKKQDGNGIVREMIFTCN